MSEPSRSVIWPTSLVFAMVALPAFLAISNQTIVAVALPAIGMDMQSLTLLPFLMSGYMLALTISGPVYGVLGDELGRGRLLLLALGLHIAGSAICALAPGIEMLAAGRVLQGIGGGGLMSLSQALIGQLVVRSDQGRAQGFIATVNVVAATASPMLGGILVVWSGWRMLFVGALVLGLLSMVSQIAKPFPRLAGTRVPFDYAGAGWMAAFVLGLAGALEGIVATWLRLPFALLSVLAMIGLIRSQRISPNPMFPPRLLRMPAIFSADVMTTCHGGVLVAFLTLVPLYHSIVLGHGIAEITWLLLAITLGSGATGLVIGLLISRTGRLGVFPRLGLPLAAVGIAGLPLFGPELSPLGQILFYTGIGMGLGTVMSVAMATIMICSPPDLVGRAAGNITFFRSVGALLVTALASLVLFALAPAGATIATARALGSQDWSMAFHAAFGVVVLFIVIAWVMAFRLPERMPQ